MYEVRKGSKTKIEVGTAEFRKQFWNVFRHITWFVFSIKSAKGEGACVLSFFVFWSFNFTISVFSSSYSFASYLHFIAISFDILAEVAVWSPKRVGWACFLNQVFEDITLCLLFPNPVIKALCFTWTRSKFLVTFYDLQTSLGKKITYWIKVDKTLSFPFKMQRILRECRSK